MSSKIEMFGNYMLLEKIASGGMAEVFLARPAVREGDGRLLVVKRILPHIASQHEFLNMFQREIQIIMGFNHPHVVQLHDFGAVDGQPYIAMEYIEGKSLREVNDRLRDTNAMMPMSVAMSLIAQAASGLYYAHTFQHKTNGTPLNAIHRDISPHNLIVSFDGNLKVIDFGIAKAATSMVELSRTGTIKGKVGYFSPEQLEGQPLDARSDIFSLGVVAWELLTGQKLFSKPGDTEVSIMKRVHECEKHVVPPSSINNAIPAEVDQTILTALEKDPNKRFREAREFQAELRRHLLKFFPDHTYANTGELVKELFRADMIKHHQQTKEVNQRAQEMLAGSADDDTAIITVGELNPRALNEKSNERGHITEEMVAMRLSKIEAALKQKASTRHYMMLAFYIVTIIALKFGDLRGIWLDLVAPNAHAEAMSSLATSRPVAKAHTPGRR